MDNAAAATAGQRLIPAPQVTKVGTRILIRLATVLTAKKSSSARLPEPSNNGKRQKTNSRGVCRDGSSAASWTKTFTPKSKIFGKSRLSPAWPSHRGYGSIWFMGTSQLPHEPTAKERSAQEMFELQVAGIDTNIYDAATDDHVQAEFLTASNQGRAFGARIQPYFSHGLLSDLLHNLQSNFGG